MKVIFTLLLVLFIWEANSQKQTYLLAGTYTGGKSKGIYVYRFTADGSFHPVDTVVAANPSYLAVSPNQKLVYSVNELGAQEGGGKATAYRFISQTGRLEQINQQDAMGDHPCYITVDKTGKWVIIGNYSSGNVAVLPVMASGGLDKAKTVVQHHGSSAHPRQKSPHVHATVLSANNKHLFVPDLGTDKLMVYSFQEKKGSLTPLDTTLKMPAGSGPRHFDFHPSQKWAYLLQELSGTVTALQYSKGRLKPVQTLRVLPAGFSKPFTSADIHVSPDGKFLYTSTRDESNTIAWFRINPLNGKLTLGGHQSSLGKTPRNFSIDPSGSFLLAANQNSDEIVVFSINKKSGALTDTGKRITMGNPVCLKWIVQ